MTPNNPTDDPLRHAFRAYANHLSADHTPPPAATILFRAERRRRHHAIQRAERPLLIMQIAATLAALPTIAWLLYRLAPHTLPALTPTTIALAITCTLLVLAACATMLHASRTPST